jgi:hypothetical protein
VTSQSPGNLGARIQGLALYKVFPWPGDITTVGNCIVLRKQSVDLQLVLLNNEGERRDDSHRIDTRLLSRAEYGRNVLGDESQPWLSRVGCIFKAHGLKAQNQ